MQEKRRKYSPEFKAEAARLVVETSRPIVDVAREIGVHEGTLGSWVNKYRAEHAGDEPPLTLSERARLRGLERENRELRMKTEFLGKPLPSSRLCHDHLIRRGSLASSLPRPVGWWLVLDVWPRRVRRRATAWLDRSLPGCSIEACPPRSVAS
jgi:transposase-like protein